MIEKEKLYDALSLISQGIVQPTKIAKAMGMSYRSYCDWMLRSNRGDERFLIEFMGAEMQWAAAIVQARRLAMFELRGMLEQYSIFGRDEVSYKDGQVVFKIDMKAAALDEDTREMLGDRKEALLGIDGAWQGVMLH